jgi:hypothetical protein
MQARHQRNTMIIYLQQHLPLVLGLIALAVSLFELIRSCQKIFKIGWNGWRNILMSLGAKYRQPVDVSYQLIPPPSMAKGNIETLKALGFRRLGEAQVKSPFNPPITVWIFTHLETKIQAEAAGKRVGFSTFFQEKTLLVTDYPNGEHIEIPNYQSHTIVTSVSHAYRYHLHQVDKFSRLFGEPHQIRNMTDYLHWETVARKNYATRKLMRWVWPNLVRLAAFTYGCIILILVPVFFDPQKIPVMPHAGLFSSQEALIYLMILLILPAILVSKYANRRAVRQTHKDSRMHGKSQRQ